MWRCDVVTEHSATWRSVTVAVVTKCDVSPLLASLVSSAFWRCSLPIKSFMISVKITSGCWSKTNSDMVFPSEVCRANVRILCVPCPSTPAKPKKDSCSGEGARPQSEHVWKAGFCRLDGGQANQRGNVQEGGDDDEDGWRCKGCRHSIIPCVSERS